jgi:thiamine kinase-like enzyme
MKANQSDFDSLREALQHKADKNQTKKDIDRLDSLLEELRQNMSDFEDKNKAMSKEVDRLAQFVEMLSKSMNSLRN